MPRSEHSWMENHEIRNEALRIMQNLDNKNDKKIIEELAMRFSDYTEIQTTHLPTPKTEDETPHEKRLAELKFATDFFTTMSNILSNLGLVNNWKQGLREMSLGVYERVREDRAKYHRTVDLIAEIYTVHFGANGAVISMEALPDPIREVVTKKLKERKLLRD